MRPLFLEKGIAAGRTTRTSGGRAFFIKFSRLPSKNMALVRTVGFKNYVTSPTLLEQISAKTFAEMSKLVTIYQLELPLAAL